VGWLYILYEIFSGEAGKLIAKSTNKPLVTAFETMRMIVTIGWAIYPLGYVFGYLTGGVDSNTLNVIYNLLISLTKSLLVWLFGLLLQPILVDQDDNNKNFNC